MIYLFSMTAEYQSVGLETFTVDILTIIVKQLLSLTLVYRGLLSTYLIKRNRKYL